jgi:hypothetical protein
MGLGEWLKRLFEEPPPKPRPVGWNKTLKDLDAEKRSLTGDEMRWAREYEQEELRKWARFPKDGDEYAARHDVRITYILHWRAPYSTGGEGDLPKGSRVRVSVNAANPEPIGVYAMPEDEKGFEERVIPAIDRGDSKYGGYSLFIDVARLNRDFEYLPRT